MKSLIAVVSLVTAIVLVACSGGSGTTPQPTLPAIRSIALPSLVVSSAAAGSGSLPSGQQLCALLTANDWAQVNLSQASAAPTINSDGPGSAYCTYSGTAGASGGLEFDAFAEQVPSDAQDTFNTMSGELPGGQPATLPGADAALINANVDGTYGVIIVRNGRFTYSIALPASNASDTQLQTLAALVLTRAQQYK